MKQRRDETLGTLAAILTGLDYTQAVPLLAKVLATVGITGPAAAAALRLSAKPPTNLAIPEGPAGHVIRDGEPGYAAAFLLASAERIAAALASGQTLAQAVATEQRYWAQHVAATLHRAAAGRQIDRTARIYGDLLGWYLGDRKTHTPVCVAADHHNFDATIRPLPGFPGTSHALCGCRAGPPFYGATSVDSVTRPLIAAGLD